MDEVLGDINKLDEIIDSEKFEFLNELDTCLSDEDENENDITVFEDRVQDNAHSTNSELIQNIDVNSDVHIDQIKAYLSSQDLQMIMQCKDEKLKRLMILNRHKLIQLKSLTVYLDALLMKCAIKCVNVKDNLKIMTKLRRLGHPYFKYTNGCTCPPNVDVITKKSHGEIWTDYLLRAKIWTERDIALLKEGISLFVYKHERNQLHEKLRMLKTKMDNAYTVNERRSIQIEIQKVEEMLNKPRNKSELYSSESAMDDIDWHHISDQNLRGRHSARSCKAIFNIFLHPAMNHSSWSKDELNRLYSIAESYSCQKWEVIAQTLKTNRSAYVCCVQYYTRKVFKTYMKIFTSEEDKKLLDIINKCRKGNYIPWNVVEHYFDGRLKPQLYARYKHVLQYEDRLNKGNFSKVEDIILYCTCKVYGENFKLCQKILKQRNETQIKRRYKNYIDQTQMTHNGYFTLEEDKVILEHMNSKGDVKPIKVKDILNRTSSSIRHRSYLLHDWLKKNPGQSIENMCRKKGALYNGNQHIQEVRLLGDEFISTKMDINIQNVTQFLQKRDSKRKGRPSGTTMKSKVFGLNNDFDLINYFKKAITTKNVSTKVKNQNYIRITVEMIAQYLKMLNARLEIPDDDSLKSMPDLDETDLILLGQLRNMVCNTEYEEQSTYISPILSTAVSLRNLLLNFMNYKKQYSNVQRMIISRSLPQRIAALTEEEANSHAKDSNTFANRLDLIYIWPSLMSLVKREYESCPSNQLSSLIDTKSNEPKKVGRPKKDFTKIHLMRKAKLKLQEPSENSTTSVLTNFEMKPTFTSKPMFTYGNNKRMLRDAKQTIDTQEDGSEKQNSNSLILCVNYTMSNTNVKINDGQTSKSTVQSVIQRVNKHKRNIEPLERPSIKMAKSEIADEPSIQLELEEDIKLLDAALNAD